MKEMRGFAEKTGAFSTLASEGTSGKTHIYGCVWAKKCYNRPCLSERRLQMHIIVFFLNGDLMPALDQILHRRQ